MADRLSAQFLAQNSQPPSDKMLRVNGNKPESQKLEEAGEFALQSVCQYMRQILKRSATNETCSNKHICVLQAHVCKKDIMFTAFVIGLVLGQENGIDFLWSSDSDSLLCPNAVGDTVRCMAVEDSIGGAATALSVHNSQDSIITRLAWAAYWSELAVTRGQTGAFDASDCQPGPCAAFRMQALSQVLMPWYSQKVMGFKTVRLLL
jgi:hyaluronan synthase